MLMIDHMYNNPVLAVFSDMLITHMKDVRSRRKKNLMEKSSCKAANTTSTTTPTTSTTSISSSSSTNDHYNNNDHNDSHQHTTNNDDDDYDTYSSLSLPSSSPSSSSSRVMRSLTTDEEEEGGPMIVDEHHPLLLSTATANNSTNTLPNNNNPRSINLRYRLSSLSSSSAMISLRNIFYKTKGHIVVVEDDDGIFTPDPVLLRRTQLVFRWWLLITLHNNPRIRKHRKALLVKEIIAEDNEDEE
eukprot:TRINITY_DN2371_c10_g1_i1.p1 TRINITY_DN2371_c10_g1~~TRINITY_DN2371_c10_g1_i1.p1  ORF type:complete len:244 (-),score=67.60 TRINITY_DN2371_c10_g1_i1:15-746(-)